MEEKKTKSRIKILIAVLVVGLIVGFFLGFDHIKSLFMEVGPAIIEKPAG